MKFERLPPQGEWVGGVRLVAETPEEGKILRRVWLSARLQVVSYLQAHPKEGGMTGDELELVFPAEKKEEK